jgi:hypothetical protein
LALFSGLDDREYGRRDLLRWPRDTLYLQKLALTSEKRRSLGRCSSLADWGYGVLATNRASFSFPVQYVLTFQNPMALHGLFVTL